MTSNRESEDISVDGIALRPAYASFSRGKLDNNEKEFPGQGYAVAYHGLPGEATVYVYSKGQCQIPDGPSSRIVLDEFNGSVHDVLLYGEVQGIATTLIDRYGTGGPGRGREFLCAEFVGATRRDRGARSST